MLSSLDNATLVSVKLQLSVISVIFHHGMDNMFWVKVTWPIQSHSRQCNDYSQFPWSRHSMTRSIVIFDCPVQLSLRSKTDVRFKHCVMIIMRMQSDSDITNCVKIDQCFPEDTFEIVLSSLKAGLLKMSDCLPPDLTKCVKWYNVRDFALHDQRGV